jgi:hypothetical protein
MCDLDAKSIGSIRVLLVVSVCSRSLWYLCNWLMHLCISYLESILPSIFRSFIHKRIAVAATSYHQPLPVSRPPIISTPISPFRPLHPPVPIGMSSSTATRVYFAQPSAGNHQHCQSLGPVLPSSTFPSATLVNQAPAVNERPSVKLKIISGKTNIVNSVVVNAAGQSLYSISSNSKRTTVVACKDNVEVATVDWDRSSPRMVFRRKKMKCKEWLPLAGPETEYKHTPLPSPNNSESDTARSRILTHGDSQVIWMNKSSTSGCVSI